MLSSSLIALLAASTFVNGLPIWHKRQLPGVAAIPDLGTLTGALGNIPGLDALANVPGAASPQVNAGDGGGRAGGGAAGQRQKGTNKKGNKHANSNAKTGSADVGLGANTTSIEEETGIANGTAVETGIANGTAVETGLATNGTAIVGETEANNGTAVVTEAPGNATATDEVGAGAGASTVTVTVTVTEASLSATVTSPPIASSTSVSAVDGGAQAPDITSLNNALSTSPPVQTPVSHGQGDGRGQGQAQAASVDSIDAEDAD